MCIRDSSDIETKLGQYVFLKGREKQLKVQRQSIQERINTLTQQLQKDLASYPLSKNLAFHDMLVDIRAGRSQLIELKNKLQEHEETVKKTQTEIDCIDDKIKAFLQEYYESVSPDQYSAQLSKLQKDVSFYLRAQEGIEARKKQKERREQILAECGEELNIFSEKFTRSLTLEDKEIVLRMRDDIIEAKALEKNVQEAKRDFDLFSMKHRKELATPFSDIDIRDLDELKEEEKRTVLELTEVTDTLTRHHQRLRVIQEQTDKIPSLQDDLAKWAEERKKGIKGAELLDQTIELLQQAQLHEYESTLASLRKHNAELKKMLFYQQQGSWNPSPSFDLHPLGDGGLVFWPQQAPCKQTVSYTHLDVYKRQAEADDPEGMRQEKIADYRERFANPYIAAARGYVCLLYTSRCV